jgi:hypothetical protein
MASFPWIATLLIGFVVGAVIGVGLVALVFDKKPTENLCPRCENETEEERQLKQDWADQQKGYIN